MRAKTIMVQGTASDVGKSVVCAALCRLLQRKGFRVAPFKAQNMSNNSFVTAQGGEIGRAQAVQAVASCVEPSTLMNPILLKPNTDRTSQVIVLGKVFDTLTTENYYHKQALFTEYVRQALDQLRQDYDIIVIEGAGSPAEINIKHKDIVNMSVAKSVSSPVILVGDIDKGGIFAQIIGTFDLLEDEERKLIKAFLINKFRGDKEILMPGVKWIENRIQRKSFGVLPMIPDLDIEQEDSVVLTKTKNSRHRISRYLSGDGDGTQKLLIHVFRLPRISNFTDFDHLKIEKDVHLDFVDCPHRNVIPDLLIIPGTKSTIDDLGFLKKVGFVSYIHRCLKAGSSLLGICGGYQMLGQTIEDPYRAESAIKVTNGLHLLPMKTVFSKEKTTDQVKAIHLESQLPIEGYEIHMGQTYHSGKVRPLFKITERAGRSVKGYDGLVSNIHNQGGSIFGTYLHGLFEKNHFRRHFINKIRVSSGLSKIEATAQGHRSHEPSVYDRLADEFERHMEEVYAQMLSRAKTLETRAEGFNKQASRLRREAERFKPLPKVEDK